MVTSTAGQAPSRRCVLVLGGSFDPVHTGHVALAGMFANLLQPNELRLLPVGQSWQKQGLAASAEHRVAMLERAFGDSGLPVQIDRREITRAEQQLPNYTVDTLQQLRAELGQDCSIVFAIGADQLQNLGSWQRWEQLFEFAHICAASRPGYSLEQGQENSPAVREFARRQASPDQLRLQPAGCSYLARSLHVDVSATQIRAELKHGSNKAALLPSKVLDYIQQHHLYR
jgi:nicotinate-nucleotide adenylyltransferase